jgi:hypothetical protein
MNGPDYQGTIEEILWFLGVLILLSVIYLIHLAIHGLFLQKLGEKKNIKFITSIFPSLLWSSIFIFNKDFIYIELYLLIIGVLFVADAYYWGVIIDSHSITGFLQYSEGSISIIFWIPFISTPIILCWGLLSLDQSSLLGFREKPTEMTPAPKISDTAGENGRKKVWKKVRRIVKRSG